jgi:diketogulonate reductase-like aldo/keto reductase
VRAHRTRGAHHEPGPGGGAEPDRRGGRSTPAQLALTWLPAQQPWIVPTGTNRISRLEENTGASAVEPTEEQLAELRAAADQIQIVGALYPEAQTRMTNQDAPPPSA